MSTSDPAPSFENVRRNRDLFARHLPALDGIRGIAILYVILHHSQDVAWTRSGALAAAYHHVVRAGWIGVDLFFVLSGFLITGILLRTRGSPGWVTNFILRRALRVLPLYYATILVCLVLLPAVPWSPLDWLRDLSPSQAYYWMHVTNFRRIASVLDPSMPTVGWMSTFWSLSIEEHFYLTWPLVVALVPARRLPATVLALCALPLAARVALAAHGYHGQVIYYHTVTRLDGLFAGSFLAAWLYNGGSLLLLKRLAPWCMAAAALGFVVPLLLGVEQSGRDTTFYGKTLLYALAALFSAGLLITCLGPDAARWATRVLTSRPLTTVGKYSYAMYVFNKPVLVFVSWVAKSAGAGGGLVFHLVVNALAMTLTFCAAWLSWHVLEKRFLALKRFFETGRSPLTPAAVPSVAT